MKMLENYVHMRHKKIKISSSQGMRETKIQRTRHFMSNYLNFGFPAFLERMISFFLGWLSKIFITMINNWIIYSACFVRLFPWRTKNRHNIDPILSWYAGIFFSKNSTNNQFLKLLLVLFFRTFSLDSSSFLNFGLPHSWRGWYLYSPVFHADTIFQHSHDFIHQLMKLFTLNDFRSSFCFSLKKKAKRSHPLQECGKPKVK